MKKYVFYILAILALYSFQNNPNKDKNIYRFVILKKEDWAYLSQYTIISKEKVALVYTTCHIDIIQKVQYESEKQRLTDFQKKKLMDVLKKYE